LTIVTIDLLMYYTNLFRDNRGAGKVPRSIHREAAKQSKAW